MPHLSRIYASDEELSKRDDDHKPSAVYPWQTRLPWRRRRILLGLVALFFIWLFIHNIPTDLGSIDQRMGRPLRPGHTVGGLEFGYRPPPHKENDRTKSQQTSSEKPTGPPPRNDASAEDEHYYLGPIKFFDLASSLHKITRTNGHRPNNRNVLFAAASLKSVANLIPMACEMASRDRNHVHFAILGRESLAIEDLMEINGVDKATCSVHFHDGRPDYSEYSSDLRAEVSVAGAMAHINTFMHPQVILTDDSVAEDAYFTKGMRSKAKEIERPIIEVPAGKYEDFLWMTRLDHASLASWHKPVINFLVHAPPQSSGSLIRMLDSLKAADYAGLSPPQLTLDLPADIEPFARHYIRSMTWPPVSDPLMPHKNNVILHHRISPAKATTESNAMRLLESFYPANTDDSHVLLLSSQVELSPLFYHYLVFHILEYRYSSYGTYNSEHLLGLALPTPESYLNGTTPFAAPSITDMNGRKHDNLAKDAEQDQSMPFLWRAPNADAALIFGDKWAELHDYLKNRLRAIHDPATVQKPPTKPHKLISETQPGWTEYLLELMRARGWSMLYPATRGAGGWATVHQDLYQAPEEFTTQAPDRESDRQDGDLPDTEEPFLSGEIGVLESPKEQRNVVRHSQSLHAVLPFNGDLSDLTDLPSMSHEGELLPAYVLDNEVAHYKEKLRQQVGGCTVAQAGLNRAVVAGITDDLFCFLEQEVEGEDQVSGAEETAKTSAQDTKPGGAGAEAPGPKVVDSKPVDDGVPRERVLDSTAKQKAAYAKVLGGAVDEPVVKPAVQTVKPVAEAVKPVVDAVKPAVEAVKPAVDTLKPAVEAVKPTVEAVKPVEEHKGSLKAVVEDLGPPNPTEKHGGA